MRHVRGCTITSVVAALLLGFFPAEGAADTPQLRTVTLGHLNIMRNRFEAPLLVDIENPGPERTVIIQAEGLGSFAGQQLLYARPVWLPANCRRQVEYPVLPDVAETGSADGSPMTQPFLVRLLAVDGRAYDQREAYSVMVPEDSFLVLIGDSRYTNYQFLKDADIAPNRRRIARVSLHPRDLPRRPLDYRGVDAVILGDHADTALTPLQLRALRDWVRLGGCLINVPGPTATDNRLHDWMPVTYFSRHDVETVPALDPAARFVNRVTLFRMFLRDGRLLHGTPERPVAAIRREGLGKVIALAVDAGAEELQAWPGARDWWATLFAEATPPPLQHANRILDRTAAIEGIMSSLAGIKVLPRPHLLVYLAVTVGVMLVLVYGFRSARAPEWGWGAAVAAALLGGAGAVVAAHLWKAQPTAFLNELSITTGCSANDTARTQAAIGLFSPQEEHYTITTAADDAALRPGRTLTVPPELFTPIYEARQTITQLRVHANDLRLLHGLASRPEQPTPRVQVRIGGDGLSLMISNSTAVALEDGFLKFNRLVVPLGDLPTGAATAKDALTATTDRQFSSRLVRTGSDELRARFREILFPEPSFGGAPGRFSEERQAYRAFRGSEPGPVYCAWSDVPQFPLASVSPPVQRRAIGLWAVEAELRYATDRLWLPKGVLPLQVRNKAGRILARGDDHFAGTRSGLLLLEFGLPPDCPDLAIEEALVHLTFRGAAYVPQVLVGPAGHPLSEEDNDLTGFERLTGSAPYRIPTPARFFDRHRRSFLLAVQVNAAAGDDENAELAGLSTWQIRELDLSLKGAVR